MLLFPGKGDRVKKHLTDAFLQRVKPPQEGYLEIFDLGYPGLAFRVGHGGAKSFLDYYRIDGRLTHPTLGRYPGISLAASRDSWRKTREALAKGEVPHNDAPPKTPAMLFERVVEEWIKRDQSSNKASTQYQVVRT